MDKDVIMKLENKNKQLERDMCELVDKLEEAKQQFKEMQQQSGPKALHPHLNWETDSGVSSPVLSFCTQLDNQSPEQSLVLDVENKGQDLQQYLEKIKAELAEEKGKNKNLSEELRKFQIKRQNWFNFYQDLENDHYLGLNVQMNHIYKLEDECHRLQKSNRYFKSRVYNKGINSAVNNSNDLKK